MSLFLSLCLLCLLPILVVSTTPSMPATTTTAISVWPQTPQTAGSLLSITATVNAPTSNSTPQGIVSFQFQRRNNITGFIVNLTAGVAICVVNTSRWASGFYTLNVTYISANSSSWSSSTSLINNYEISPCKVRIGKALFWLTFSIYGLILFCIVVAFFAVIIGLLRNHGKKINLAEISSLKDYITGESLTRELELVSGVSTISAYSTNSLRGNQLLLLSTVLVSGMLTTILYLNFIDNDGPCWCDYLILLSFWSLMLVGIFPSNDILFKPKIPAEGSLLRQTFLDCEGIKKVQMRDYNTIFCYRMSPFWSSQLHTLGALGFLFGAPIWLIVQSKRDNAGAPYAESIVAISGASLGVSCLFIIAQAVIAVRLWNLQNQGAIKTKDERCCGACKRSQPTQAQGQEQEQAQGEYELEATAFQTNPENKELKEKNGKSFLGPDRGESEPTKIKYEEVEEEIKVTRYLLTKDGTRIEQGTLKKPKLPFPWHIVSYVIEFLAFFLAVFNCFHAELRKFLYSCDQYDAVSQW